MKNYAETFYENPYNHFLLFFHIFEKILDETEFKRQIIIKKTKERKTGISNVLFHSFLLVHDQMRTQKLQRYPQPKEPENVPSTEKHEDYEQMKHLDLSSLGLFLMKLSR